MRDTRNGAARGVVGLNSGSGAVDTMALLGIVVKGEEEEGQESWVAEECPRGGVRQGEEAVPAMPTTTEGDMIEGGKGGAAAPSGRHLGAGAEGERGPSPEKREEEGLAAGSGPHKEEGRPPEAEDDGESAESGVWRNKEVKEEVMEEVNQEGLCERGSASEAEEEDSSPPPTTNPARVPMSQGDEDRSAPAAAAAVRVPSGSSEVSAPPPPPLVASPPPRGLHLATDPAGVRGPSLSTAHLPPPPTLADFEYMLPPGLHSSTASAAAAFAAAASRIICFPPHPAALKVPKHTTPPLTADPPQPPALTASRPPNGVPAKAEASQVRQVAVYVCVPCGIKFSSASTLDAHQTYYCSHRSSALGSSPGATATPAPARPSPSSPAPSAAHATAEDVQQTTIRSTVTPSGGGIRVRSGASESEAGGGGGRPHSVEVDQNRSPVTEEGCLPAKVPRVSRPFPCPHCSYSADKKVSLNRHMRMHMGGGVIVSSSAASSSASSSPSSSTPPPPPPPPQLISPVPPPASSLPSTAPIPSVSTQLHHLLQQGVVVGPGSNGPRRPDITPPTSSPDPSSPSLAMDRHCQQCDIRFSSVKTFRAHKQHYCSTRHGGSGGKTTSGPEGHPDSDRSLEAPESAAPPIPSSIPPPSALQVKQHLLKPPFVALPTSPVLLVPYAFLQSASLVVAGTPAPKGACILLPDGSLRPVSPSPPTTVLQEPSLVKRRTPPSPDLPAPPPPPAVTPLQPITTKPKEVDSECAKVPMSQPGSSSASPLDLSVRRDSSESQSSRTNSHHYSNGSNRRFLKKPQEGEDKSLQEVVMAVTAKQQQLGRRPSSSGESKAAAGGPHSPPSHQLSTDGHAHSPASSTSSPAASSSSSVSPCPKARPSRPNGMSKGPPPPPLNQLPMFPSSTPPPALPPHLQQQFSSGIEGGLGMANLFLAACAAAAAATAGPEGMAKAAAAAVAAGAAGTTAAAAQAALPFLLTPELALRMFMGSTATGLPTPDGLRPGPPNIIPPPITPPQPPPAVAPQVLVKQGVSKCVECNIVFCRHENFLAHKRHYCAARLVADGADAEATSQVAAASSSVQGGGTERVQRGAGGASDHSSEPSSPKASSIVSSPQGGQAPGAVAPLPPKTLLQFICVACGIKFTSLDNLQAHQMYYCLKRDQGPQKGSLSPADVDRVLRKCPKCKISVPEEALLRHQCPSTYGCGPSASQPGVASSVAGWKCPCCDVLSPTASAAQRHVETHAGSGAVRAFRCTHCGYRGNTLRGMRTHIRAHFEAQAPHSPELQEENFIACILEDDSEVPPMVPVVAAAAPRSATPALDHTSATSDSDGERMHYCEMCGYSSTYKGNVVRHLKLVHKCAHPGGPTEEGVLGPGVALVKGEGGSNSSASPSPGPQGVDDPSSALVVNGYGHGMMEVDEDDEEVRAESLVKVEMREVEEGEEEVQLGVKEDSGEESAVSPAVAIKREVASPGSGEEGNSWGGRCSSAHSRVPSQDDVKREPEDLNTSCTKDIRSR